MARWEEALDAQLEFTARIGSNPTERAYTRNAVADMYSVASHYEGAMPLAMPDEQIKEMPDRLAVYAYNADAVYVDPDMMTIWENSIEGFKAEPLVAEDLITPAGFLWLPRPYMKHDTHGKAVSVRALLWHPLPIGVREPPQHKWEELEYNPENPTHIKSEVGGYRMPVRRDPDGSMVADGIMFAELHLAADADDYSSAKRGYEPPGLHLAHLLPWAYGTSFSEEAVDMKPDSVLAYQALWRLMQQTIATRMAHRPDRPTRKRLARESWPEREITVIRLRRPEPPREKDDEAKVVNWTHRWIVGGSHGFWRNQYYPSIGMHRQILVAPYVKGPPDMPLMRKKGRVFELVR